MVFFRLSHHFGNYLSQCSARYPSGDTVISRRDLYCSSVGVTNHVALHRDVRNFAWRHVVFHVVVHYMSGRCLCILSPPWTISSCNPFNWWHIFSIKWIGTFKSLSTSLLLLAHRMLLIWLCCIILSCLSEPYHAAGYYMRSEDINDVRAFCL